MQRPSVAPVVEPGGEVEGVEARGHVGDDPEDEPERRPGLADDHGDVLAGDAEGDHAHEVDHPVHDESPLAVRVGARGDFRRGGRGVRKGDLEGEADE